MKKLSSLFSVISIFLVYLAGSLPSYAASSFCPTGQFSALCTLQLSSGGTVVGNVVTIMLVFAVIVCLIFLILGGIRWIMSGGDKGKVDSARGTITSAIVGLVIAFLAFFILNVITLLFTKHTATNFTVPTIVP